MNSERRSSRASSPNGSRRTARVEFAAGSTARRAFLSRVSGSTVKPITSSFAKPWKINPIPKPMKPKLKTSRFQYHPDSSRPKIHQHAAEIQPFGTIVELPIALSHKICQESVERLNQILADTM